MKRISTRGLSTKNPSQKKSYPSKFRNAVLMICIPEKSVSKYAKMTASGRVLTKYSLLQVLVHFFLVRNIFKTPYRKKTKESSTWTSISTIRRGLLGIYRNYSLFKVCVKSYLVRRTTRLHQIITPTGLKTKELQLVRERRFSHQHRGKGRITECHARDGRM